MTGQIMLQGTMSGAGKSFLTAALCRIFHQDGYRTAPFKAQNMALNSAVTADGLELGRAQAAQAEAAGREPDVRMNPVLLKPTGDRTSQLIVNGRVRGQYGAAEYFRIRETLMPEILSAYRSLAAENDLMVIEGAGSPAEINLKRGDIVNMGLAERINAPVVLVGDIYPGGVFAQICGTLDLLERRERDRVAGVLINRFRGDPALFQSGVRMLEDRIGIPVLGVIPWINAELDEEDSLSPQLTRRVHDRVVDIAVIRFPRISNFTDFPPLERHPALGVRYAAEAAELGRPDLVILPGTKDTMGDLRWMRESGIEAAILALAGEGTPVLGICGGYQMLGTVLRDPEGAEGLVQGAEMDGMGLLPVETVFRKEKARSLVTARTVCPSLEGAHIRGYEIHMGRTARVDGGATAGGAAPIPFAVRDDGTPEGLARGNVYGTFLHGLFDTGELTGTLAAFLLARRGLPAGDHTVEDRRTCRERQYDRMAAAVRESVDLAAVYRIAGVSSDCREKEYTTARYSPTEKWGYC